MINQTLSLNKKRILIVEDDQSLSKVLGLKLINAGFEVVIADDGAHALDQLSRTKFHLILLDLLMPGIDGWTVLEKLKGSGQKIIVTSNLSQDEDIKKAKALGALDFLVKSDIPLINIVQKVNAILA